MTDERKGTELTQTKPADILGITADATLMSMEDLLTVADQRSQLIDKLTKIALQKLSTREVVDFQGNPYFPASACHKFARTFGVSWSLGDPKATTLEDDKGKFTVWMVRGIFKIGSESCEAIGRCSTRDKFFAVITEYMANPDDPNGQKIKVAKLRPQSDVDPCDVIGKAVSNCEHNGITRILGLKGLTWEDIEKHAKIKRSDVVGVKFDEGGKKSGRSSAASGNSKGGGATEGQRKMIYAIAKKNGQDPNEFCQKIAGTRLDDLPFGKVNEVLAALNKLDKGKEG